MTPPSIPYGAARGRDGQPIRVLTELGIERRCSGCKDFWPEDAGFFRPKRGGFTSYCRACEAEARERRRHRGYTVGVWKRAA